MIAKSIIVSGLVQGVGFRAWMQSEAQNLGLQGWVRNLEDGSVEALLQGDPVLIEEMLQLCKKGPRYARVSDIRISEQKSLTEIAAFYIK